MRTLLLIDANALIHRAFHALPPLTTPDGQPIGAIYGLANTLLKILKDQPPDYIAGAFDRPEPTFRDELFKDYKAHRPKAADELVSQIIRARELFQKFGISFFEQPGFEADDIIGKLVEMFRDESDLKIVILTGDLDTLQLVRGKQVVVQTPKKGLSETTIYDEGAVVERFGLKPHQVPDYKGLVGDPSDNIPGVPGIGPKTAAKILNEYQNLETLYKGVKPKDSLTQKLINYKSQALLSKKLATINPNLPLETNLSALGYRDLETEKIVPYFTKLGFQSLINRLFNQSRLFSNTNFEEMSSQNNALVVSGTEFALTNQSLLANPQKMKVAFDWKPIFKTLVSKKIEVAGPIFDIKIGAWLIDPDQKDFSPENLSRRFLHRTSLNDEDQNLLSLYFFLKQRMVDYQLIEVFEKIEIPLIKILATTENWGIAINRPALKKLRQRIDHELSESAKKIYHEAGNEFNINSPQQVASILFKKLNLGGPRLKKTTTGRSSTAEDVLLEFKEKHPIVNLILEYREGFKLKSTYIEPILEMSAKDGRIHTNFLQTGTATGRLSSEKPNVQNVPQESKWARDLRSAFQAKENFSFVTFDYSQLQLKLLAHVSGDEQLIKAFRERLDIHQLTAARVFKLPPTEINGEMRRLGKTLNFGVIYGMGSRAFAKTSNLTLAEADKFIKEYFAEFPQVKIWQEKIKAEAKTFGYVKNLNGRRRWFLDIVSGQPRADYEIERAAINMPVQSLEADIIKIAMIKSFAVLEKNRWLDTKAKLLLTIHDELLFELSDDILKKALPLIKKTMEQIYPLAVPLTVDVKIGKNWGAMENYHE